MSPLSHHLHRACAHTLKTATRQSPITATTTTLLTRSSSSPSPKKTTTAALAPFSTTAAAALADNAPRPQRFRHSPARCLRCNEPGHWARDCKNPKRCYNCNETGHDVHACPSPPRCHRCGGTDHRIAECPDKFTIPHCSLCGGRHEARDCEYKLELRVGKAGRDEPKPEETS